AVHDGVDVGSLRILAPVELPLVLEIRVAGALGREVGPPAARRVVAPAPEAVGGDHARVDLRERRRPAVRGPSGGARGAGRSAAPRGPRRATAAGGARRPATAGAARGSAPA